jgi:hypothetical protein
MYAATADAAVQLMSRGARIITIGSDLLFLEQGMSSAAGQMLPVRDWHIGGPGQ